jgi:dolichol kinase
VNTTTNSLSRGFAELAAVFAVGLGLLFAVYGVLVLPASALGGLWLVTIGLSYLLAGVLTTAWAGRRLGLAAGRRRSLAMALAVLGTLLLAAFVVVNYVSFAPGFVEGTSSSGGSGGS